MENTNPIIVIVSRSVLIDPEVFYVPQLTSPLQQRGTNLHNQIWTMGLISVWFWHLPDAWGGGLDLDLSLDVWGQPAGPDPLASPAAWRVCAGGHGAGRPP